jgi:TolA-binding protein
MLGRRRIFEDLHSTTAIAAAAALLALSACATGGGQVQQDVVSLRTEVRTLQRENAELARRVESMATQIDLLAARAARPVAPAAGGDRPVASGAPAPSVPASVASVAALDDALVIPSDLKVIRLEPARKSPASKPVVPTATPIQDPSAEAIAALDAGGKPSSDAQAAFERASAQAGLPGARALEQFADVHPSSVRAGEALVDAARRRRDAGDPDGSCEDFSRAVAEYPSSRAMPDALEGLAACELRRGRPAEASRLQTRLAKDFPDSPAGKRAREHAPPVQGAAP